MHTVLAKAGIFHDVETRAAASLASAMQRHTFPRHATICPDGEPGDRLYVIISGKVRLGRRAHDGRESLITVLGPGDIFGELALFDAGPAMSTVTALTATRAVSVDRDTLRSWIFQYPSVGQNLLRLMARRLRETTGIVADQIVADMPCRIARALLSLPRHIETRGEDKTVRVKYDITQTELAQLVGTSRVVVNKVLLDFSERGWIRSKGKTIWIIDRASLSRRAK